MVLFHVPSKAKDVLEAMRKAQRDNNFRAAQRKIRENKRNIRRGLAVRNR